MSNPKWNLSGPIPEELKRIQEKHQILQPNRSQEDWANMLLEYARRAKYASQYDPEDFERWMARAASIAIVALENHESRYAPPKENE